MNTKKKKKRKIGLLLLLTVILIVGVFYAFSGKDKILLDCLEKEGTNLSSIISTIQKDFVLEGVLKDSSKNAYKELYIHSFNPLESLNNEQINSIRNILGGLDIKDLDSSKSCFLKAIALNNHLKSLVSLNKEIDEINMNGGNIKISFNEFMDSKIEEDWFVTKDAKLFTFLKLKHYTDE